MLQALRHLRERRQPARAVRAPPGTLELACRKNLGKTRAVMKIFSPTRMRPSFGRGASARLFLSGMLCSTLACLSIGCSDDEPAEETGIGGGTSIPDASVRDLPGEGLEPTPDFDTDSRQREPIGPQEIVENIDDLRGNPGTGNGASSALDAGADADAGASN